MTHHYIRQSSRMALHELGEEHRSYLEEILFDAVVTASVIVALADGRADEAERSELAAFVEQSPCLSTFTSADARQAFDSFVWEFEKSGLDSDVASAALRRVSRRSSRLEVLCAARNVARADGSVHSAEEEALGLIRLAVAPLLRA